MRARREVTSGNGDLWLAPSLRFRGLVISFTGVSGRTTSPWVYGGTWKESRRLKETPRVAQQGLMCSSASAARLDDRGMISYKGQGSFRSVRPNPIPCAVNWGAVHKQRCSPFHPNILSAFSVLKNPRFVPSKLALRSRMSDSERTGARDYRVAAGSSTLR